MRHTPYASLGRPIAVIAEDSSAGAIRIGDTIQEVLCVGMLSDGDLASRQ
ncbi:hypothetical protein CBM2594_U20127 [Cupriavidus taiwanensis]|uniref:Uncharacterized protein n=1 Tax=Cupriavidus taiwanensis TaxID=164546 RepID=A0A7Z7NRP1_9BURK|nr:hypothetical protein CBM2594_U20127 [Cupriavidus taiwanensis]